VCVCGSVERGSVHMAWYGYRGVGCGKCTGCGHRNNRKGVVQAGGVCVWQVQVKVCVCVKMVCVYVCVKAQKVCNKRPTT